MSEMIRARQTARDLKVCMGVGNGVTRDKFGYLREILNIKNSLAVVLCLYSALRASLARK